MENMYELEKQTINREIIYNGKNMPTKTKKPSKAVLKKAHKLLQKAHDRIELEGFDIENYGKKTGPCCFIGSIRAAAGIEPEPSISLAWSTSAETGDGPELSIALEYLDKASFKTKIGKDFDKPYYWGAGRFAERIGIMNAVKKPYALGVFRSAICSILKDIEN